MRNIVVGLVLVCCGVCKARGQTYPITVQRDVTALMRDGVVLRADIYRPSVPGTFPVLLQRTPYDKDKEAAFSVRAAQHGYVVIVQDVRGRYSSDGIWYPFRYESQDGFDTVEWAARLPYSNGKVGMYGSSYVGATQMLAAIAHPPHLAGICPMFTPSNYHNGWIYQDGAFEQWFNESWTSILAQDTADRYLKNITNSMQEAQTLPLTNYGLFNLPGALRSADLTPKFASYFLDWLNHPDFDAYWRPWSIEDHYADIRVPALTVAAWYDIFLGGSLRNYLGTLANGGSAAARENQRLLIAIGGHSGDGRMIGDVDFGPAAAEFNEDDVTLAWYDHLFKGMQNSFSTGKPVKIFVMGKNLWREEQEWPLRRARVTKYYLHSEGRANSIRGDGSLSTRAPQAEVVDRYVYDPQNPVPTVGGPLCCDAHLPAGPRDQRAVEKRADVLVYSTAPFAADMEVTGPVHVELYATSSAIDTDFTAKLVDVDASGYARNLTEGIVRARYRDSEAHPVDLVSGRVYQFNIDLWATSNVFLAGHQLRVEISSSNFPRFDRNLNLGEASGQATKWIQATNTIYHDVSHPSALILSVVPK